MLTIILHLFVCSGVMGGGLGGVSPQTPQMKSQVELFVGNIPVGTTQQGLVDFLNAAMLKVGVRPSARRCWSLACLLLVLLFVLLVLLVWFLLIVAVMLLLVLLRC